MPVVPPGSKVLVTGANGYIGMWVVKMLLDKGYSVRAVVRSTEKGVQLSEFFRAKGRFEFRVIEDITEEGAFDEVVKDVDAIEHVASPVHRAPEGADPETEYIIPALKGTVGILKSALKYGSQIKRIVLTSSNSTVGSISKPNPPTVYDEQDWANEAIELVRKIGTKATGMQGYIASKTLAEKAAWEFYENNKAKIPWELITLCPPFALGPPLQDPAKIPADLKSSLFIWFAFVIGKQPDEVLKSGYSFVDVRDLAEAHVTSLQAEISPPGERLIISAGETTWQETRNLLYAADPSHFDSGTIPRGTPGLDEEITSMFNNEKSITLLRMKYRERKDTFVDTLSFYESRGWLG